MDNAQVNIIYAMEGNIFNTVNVQNQIKDELVFFRNFLISNQINHEVFHSHINKINQVWFYILKDSFKRLIDIYNREYEKYRQIQYIREQETIKMARMVDTEALIGDLSDLGISTSIASLTKSFKNTGVKRSIKKGPSKKLKK